MPFFFFNDTATTEIYTLSLHDALPIFAVRHADARVALGQGDSAYGRTAVRVANGPGLPASGARRRRPRGRAAPRRSEEHTSELQSRQYLVCRLLLEKKKMENILANVKN